MKANKKTNILIELLGWYGSIAILSAYTLVSLGVIASSSLAFQLLNLTGATGIIIISVYKNVPQSVFLNLFWIGVALVSIVKILG